MSVYETEEEQIEIIKNWLKKYGKSLATGIVIALIISFGWRYWQRQQTAKRIEASMSYEELLVSINKQDDKAAETLANYLIEGYSNTAYATLAALLLAKQRVREHNLESAAEKLAWVAKKSSIPAIKQIAKIRLARVLLAQNKAEEALAILNNVSDKTFMPLTEATKGDVEIALGKKNEAKIAYQNAVSSWPKDVSGKENLKQKLSLLRN